MRKKQSNKVIAQKKAVSQTKFLKRRRSDEFRLLRAFYRAHHTIKSKAADVMRDFYKQHSSCNPV